MGTVDTFNSSSSIHINSNATGSQASTGCLIVGDIDNIGLAAVEAAELAAPTCPFVQLPRGDTIVSKAYFIQSLATCNATTTGRGQANAGWGETIAGYGKGVTIFFWDPAFDQTTCIGNSLGSGTTACMGGQLGQHFKDFSVSGGGNATATDFTVSHEVVDLNSYTQYDNMSFDGFGTDNANLLVGFNGGSNFIDNSIFNGFGTTLHAGNSSGTGSVYNLKGSSFQDYCSNTASNRVIEVEVGATWNSTQDFYANGSCATTNQHMIGNLGTINLHEDLFFPDGDTNTSQIVVNELTGAVANITDSIFRAGSAASVGFENASSGSIGYLKGNIFSVSSIGVYSVSTANTVDLGGNIGFKFSGNTNGIYSAPGHSVNGFCSGTATASSTLGLYGTGPNETTTTCSSTTLGTGISVAGSGLTLGSLAVIATHAGVSASSGVVTVLVNGSTTAITCTIGTATACYDNTHTVALNPGDRVSLQFTTQVSEVLAGVNAVVEWN